MILFWLMCCGFGIIEVLDYVFRAAHVLQWRICGIGRFPNAVDRLKKTMGF
jgi:hypothetical protein